MQAAAAGAACAAGLGGRRLLAQRRQVGHAGQVQQGAIARDARVGAAAARLPHLSTGQHRQRWWVFLTAVCEK